MDLRQIKRKTLTLAADQLVRVEPLSSGQMLPFVISPTTANLDPFAWAAKNRGSINHLLSRCGGILLRYFPITSLPDFKRLIEAISGPLIPYEYRSTPRSHIQERIYTSTEYPAEQSISLHNENAYAHTWPAK